MVVEQPMLDALFGPRPKVIVGAADAAAFRDWLNGDSADSNGLALAAFHRELGAEPCLRSLGTPAQTVVKLSGPPTGLCVLAALSDEGRAELSAFSEWWARHSPHSPPPTLELAAAGTAERNGRPAWQEELYRHLFRLAWEQARLGDERLAQTCGELYELRKEYEQARIAFNLLQDRLQYLERVPCSLIQMLPPSREVFRPEAAASGTLRQLLPVPAEGLAGFDLYCVPGESAEQAAGQWLVSLTARESGAVLGSWRFSYEQLGRGWIRCGFPEALIVPHNHLEIAVTWQTTGGPSPGFALSPIGAVHEMSARAGNKPLGHALAMAIWGALPGTRLTPPPGGWTATGEHDRASSLEYRLRERDIASIRPLQTSYFPYMHPLPDMPGFRLHPLEDEVATAVLRNGCLPGVDRIVAIAQIRNAQARHAVEYAICLTDAATRCPAFSSLPASDPRVVGFSGWEVIPADGHPHVVTLTLEKPLSVSADVFFATRMPSGCGNTHEWADWLEVRVRMTFFGGGRASCSR